jgi:hypothetical protein
MDDQFEDDTYIEKLLYNTKWENCTCPLRACGIRHWHRITCPTCKGKARIKIPGKWFKRSCPDCGSNRWIYRCCCGQLMGKGPPCAIATAVLGTAAMQELDLLRAWRHEILEQRAAGRFLSDYYRRHRGPLAELVRTRGQAKEFLRTSFIDPALKELQSERPRHALVFLCFLGVLASVTIIRIFAKLLRR